jgi:hypothetical protein
MANPRVEEIRAMTEPAGRAAPILVVALIAAAVLLAIAIAVVISTPAGAAAMRLAAVP